MKSSGTFRLASSRRFTLFVQKEFDTLACYTLFGGTSTSKHAQQNVCLRDIEYAVNHYAF